MTVEPVRPTIRCLREDLGQAKLPPAIAWVALTDFGTVLDSQHTDCAQAVCYVELRSL